MQPSMGNPEDDVGNIQGFLRKHPDFPLPFLGFAALVYVVAYCVPQLRPWFEGMEAWGFLNALKFSVFGIMSQFAIHGFITAQEDRLMKLDLKVQKNKGYEWRAEDASMRATMICLSQLVYSVMPVRRAPCSFLQFFIGYSILLIASDAWFFMVHSFAHTKFAYRALHKTHHTWKQPHAFSAYYIRSWSHVIQEQMCVIALMMLCPIPLNSFLFYMYWGTFGSQIEHSGFKLDKLKICGPIDLGHVFSAANPWGLILGTQTIPMHDYHHETFHGNFALTYAYLDKIFGTFVDPEAAKAPVDNAKPKEAPLLLDVGSLGPDLLIGA